MSTGSVDIKVMVIDDQSVMRKIISGLLLQIGITHITPAANGKEALSLISPLSEPDVIICDLHMDVMDGMQFVAAMRRKKLHIPVLILTGDGDRFMHEVSKQAGATKVLTKPISAPQLRDEINWALGFKAA